MCHVQIFVRAVGYHTGGNFLRKYFQNVVWAEGMSVRPTELFQRCTYQSTNLES